MGAIVSAIIKQVDSSTPVNPSSEQIEELISDGFGTPAVCRDFIYALHGRRFDTYEQNLHFYGYDSHVPGSWPFAYLEPNADYTDAMITEHDQAGFRLIDAIEKRLAPCEVCKPCEEKVAPAASKAAGCSAAGKCGTGLGGYLIVVVAFLAARRRRS